jgi:hypothetical protein
MMMTMSVSALCLHKDIMVDNIYTIPTATKSLAKKKKSVYVLVLLPKRQPRIPPPKRQPLIPKSKAPTTRTATTRPDAGKHFSLTNVTPLVRTSKVPSQNVSKLQSFIACDSGSSQLSRAYKLVHL